MTKAEKRPLVLVGGGGHARSVIDIIPEDREIFGYIDNHQCELQRHWGDNLPWLGTDEQYMREHKPGEHELLFTFVAGHDCRLDRRAAMIERFQDYDLGYVTAESAVISDYCDVGLGSMVMNNAVVNRGAFLFNNVVVNTGAIIEHDCRIGHNVFIGPGAVICGGVEIGDNVYIGANCTVAPGIRICDDVTIGLASAVISNIDYPGTYVGAPVRRVK